MSLSSPTAGRFPARARPGPARSPLALRIVTIEVTRRCPLACPHCSADAGPDRGAGDLELRELLALAFQVRRDFGRSVRLVLTGGDPLAREDLPVFLRLLRVLGFSPAIETNGRLLDRGLARRVAPFLSGATVSLDGTREVHERRRGPGTFAPAVRAVRRFVRAGVPEVVVATAVGADNLDGLPALSSLVRRLGAREWVVFPVAPTGRAGGRRDVGPELAELARTLRPDAGPRPVFRGVDEAPAEPGLAVLADGSVVGCVTCRGPVAGNVRRRSLASIWETGFPSREGARPCCGGSGIEH